MSKFFNKIKKEAKKYEERYAVTFLGSSPAMLFVMERNLNYDNTGVHTYVHTRPVTESYKFDTIYFDGTTSTDTTIKSYWDMNSVVSTDSSTTNTFITNTIA